MDNIKSFFKANIRNFIFSSIFAFLFTITTCWGIALDNAGTIWIKYNYLFIIFVFSLCFCGFSVFLHFLPKIENSLASIKPLPNINKLFFENNYKSFWLNFLFIAICHFPVFLAYFPGIFTYDVFYQANFFFNHDYVEINPIIHNLMIYWTLLFSDKFHTDWGGVFIYTLLQTTIMFMIFAYNIKFLSKYNVPFIFKLLALLCFAFYPTNQVFPLIATKDVLFSGFVLLFVLLLSECILDKEKFFESKTKYLLLSSAVLLMFLFRHNGFPAYILILPILLIYMLKSIKNNLKKIIIMLFIPIILFLGFSCIKKSVGIRPSPIASTIGIPIQQLGRVIFFNYKKLPEDEIKSYLKIIYPGNALAYNPICADMLKIDTAMLHSNYIEQSLKQDPMNFTSLYLKWAKDYPKEYIDAFLANNYSFWYYFAKYRTLDLHFYLYTYNRWEDIFGVKIKQFCLNKPIRIIYDNIFMRASFVNNPISFLLFSIGVNTWVIITGFLILLYKRKYDFVISLSIITTLLLSVLFGPIVLLRYIYQNFLIIPILFAFCFSTFINKAVEDKKSNENNQQNE